MKLILLGNKILVRHTYETKSKGGIELPEGAHIKSLGSHVVAVGDGKEIHPSIRPGVQVVTNPFSGQDVLWEGQQLKLLVNDDIFGIVEVQPVLSVVGSDAS